MKNNNGEMSNEELIILLQNQDEKLKKYQMQQEEKALKAKELEVELLKIQQEVDEKQRAEEELEEQRSVNRLQKFASEATIKKSEIDKSQVQLEAIDKELLDLLEKSKRRITKLANQFIDFNKEKTNLLTQNQIESRRSISGDIKSVSRYYDDSMKRNQKIINEESKKEREAQRNIAVLTKTIDLTVLNDEDDEFNLDSPNHKNSK